MGSSFSCFCQAPVEDEPKPFSYLSLKCVMQYMDVNKRFLCASHLPSLRSIHNVAPLKIDILKLESSSFTVNHMEYSFAPIVVRYSQNEQKQPKNMKWTDYVEGGSFDVGTVGALDVDEFLVQGDILIEKQREDYRRKLVERRFQEKQFSDYIGSIVKVITEAFSVIQPSHICTVENKTNFSRKYLEFPYEIKIRDVLRQQTQNLLGGRRIPQVNRLEVNATTGILRFPVGIKLEIQELCVLKHSNAMIESIKPILDEESFPLKKLSIEVCFRSDSVFQNEILRTSESLEIKCYTGDNDFWADVIINSTNKKIHLSGSYAQGYTVPTNFNSELNIYCWKSPNNEEQMVADDGKQWTIVMEIMAIGSAKPVDFVPAVEVEQP